MSTLRDGRSVRPTSHELRGPIHTSWGRASIEMVARVAVDDAEAFAESARVERESRGTTEQVKVKNMYTLGLNIRDRKEHGYSQRP